jgi:hypothetical protein
MPTSIPSPGLIRSNRMLKPWANMSSWPACMFGAIDSSYTFFWMVSGTRIMITSAALTAAAMSAVLRLAFGRARPWIGLDDRDVVADAFRFWRGRVAAVADDRSSGRRALGSASAS